MICSFAETVLHLDDFDVGFKMVEANQCCSTMPCCSVDSEPFTNFTSLDSKSLRPSFLNW